MASNYPFTHGYKDTVNDGNSGAETWARIHEGGVTLVIVERGGVPSEALIYLSHEDARAFAEEILSILEGNDA